MTTLAQLNEAQRAVKQHFEEGGSIAETLIIVSILALIIFLVYALTRRQQRSVETGIARDPDELFRTALARLPLSAEQRTLLTQLATDRDLEHPTAMLISRVRFQRESRAWLATRPDTDPATLDHAATVLFPDAP